MSRPEPTTLRRWLRGPAGAGTAVGRTARIVCCPHSGGSAAYFRSWPRWAPPGAAVLAVQYPGRHERISEPFAGGVREIADALVAEMAGEPRATVLFGHSMGASVAFETARRLRAAGLPVAGLVVSGHVPPTVPVTSEIHRLPDDEMWAALAELGGTEPEVLEMRELREVYTPVLRADLTISAAYVDPDAAGCLDIPVIALAGAADAVAPAAEMLGWAAVTTGPFTMRTLAGDHFFLDAHTEEVVGLVAGLVPAAET